jgi:hypothetical protein
MVAIVVALLVAVQFLEAEQNGVCEARQPRAGVEVLLP